MAKKIYMDINFDTKKATLTGLKEQPVIRTITESKIFKDRWKFCYYFRIFLYLLNQLNLLLN